MDHPLPLRVQPPAEATEAKQLLPEEASLNGGKKTQKIWTRSKSKGLSRWRGHAVYRRALRPDLEPTVRLELTTC